MVGMADFHVAKGAASFTCLGLGSCIGLYALDPEAHVSGMVHIMLPEAFKDKPVEKPGKFADTGIPALLAALEKAGANPRKLVMAYAGGAQVFKTGPGTLPKMDVGARNSVAVTEILRKMGARVIATDTGGNSGRTMMACSATGQIKIRTVSGGEQPLCSLRSARELRMAA